MSGTARIPWAGLFALLLVVALERSLLGVFGPWEDFPPTDFGFRSVYAGVHRDRVYLERAHATPADDTRVLVVGNSRSDQGFDLATARRSWPDAHFYKFAHTMMDPFVIASNVEELLAARPSAAVFYLNEMETHRPLRLEPLPATSAASVGTALHLVQRAGLGFAHQERASLSRVAMAQLSPTYRFRDLIARAYLNRWREFELPERLTGRRTPQLLARAVLGDARRGRLTNPEKRYYRSQLPPHSGRRLYQLEWFAEIQRGLHADIQMELLGGVFERMADAGVEVILADLPMHSLGQALPEPGAREEHLAFVEAQARSHPRITRIAREAFTGLGDEHVRDMLHLRPSGAAIATELTLEVLGERLAR